MFEGFEQGDGTEISDLTHKGAEISHSAQWRITGIFILAADDALIDRGVTAKARRRMPQQVRRRERAGSRGLSCGDFLEQLGGFEDFPNGIKPLSFLLIVVAPLYGYRLVADSPVGCQQ